MCNKKGASVANKSLIYLNTPITSCSEDVFCQYQQLINLTVKGGLSKQTIKYVPAFLVVPFS